MTDDNPVKSSRTKAKSTKKATAAGSTKSTTSIASLKVADLSKMISAEVSKAIRGIGGSSAGVHVNSGPPGFVNGGGHANFDPRTAAGGFIDPRALSGSHVNSGPPGFVNGGGHANFDPRTAAGGFIDPRALSGSHVNSGPPGFVNGGGHANFDPKANLEFQQVILPDRSVVHIPATGPVNIIVRGFRITRS
jgi:hypothetical protein